MLWVLNVPHRIYLVETVERKLLKNLCPGGVLFGNVALLGCFRGCLAGQARQDHLVDVCNSDVSV